MSFNRQPLGQKPPKSKPNPAYLAEVRLRRCCICEAFGEIQYTPTRAHHVFHGRFSKKRTPDEMAIPLCDDHHQLGGNGKIAVHLEKARWAEVYGKDHDYTAATQDAILGARQ